MTSLKDDLKVGNIVKIRGRQSAQVVTSCGMQVEAAYDGNYHCYQFSTVDLPQQSAVDVAMDNPLRTVAPKEHKYFLSGYSMRGDGKEIDATDVKIIGHFNLKKDVTVTYRMDYVRMI
jgi:hypothetical protein